MRSKLDWQFSTFEAFSLFKCFGGKDYKIILMMVKLRYIMETFHDREHVKNSYVMFEAFD